MFTKVKRSLGIYHARNFIPNHLRVFFKVAEYGHVHGRTWVIFRGYYSLAFVSMLFLRASCGHHEDNLAIGIAIHHFTYRHNPNYFINSQLNTKVIYDLCGHDTTRYFVSDYSPVLNKYTTQITAVDRNLISHFVYHHFCSEGHKFNIAKVSMIIPIVLATFIILAPRKRVGLFATIFFFFKK
jgi:hypothetical protein